MHQCDEQDERKERRDKLLEPQLLHGDIPPIRAWKARLPITYDLIEAIQAEGDLGIGSLKNF